MMEELRFNLCLTSPKIMNRLCPPACKSMLLIYIFILKYVLLPPARQNDLKFKKITLTSRRKLRQDLMFSSFSPVVRHALLLA
jgi:hypothetical protein